MSDAVIIGSGLGGLLCGRILSRKGLTVTLLEASDVPGGLLHSFTWEGVRCEQGFHSAGGLGPGEPLEKIFRPLGLMELPWYRAEPDEGFPFLRLNTRSDYETEHVLGPFRQSVWRLRGGGDTLVQALAEGLDIRYRKKAVSIDNQKVICDDGSVFPASYIISDLSPSATVSLLKDHIRPAYLRRLNALENGPCITTVYCLLEAGCVPWQSGAIFLEESLMMHFGEPETGILELLCFGEGDPETMVARAGQRLPGLRIRKTLVRHSEGYGIVKRDPADFVSAKTPLPWLFLTGQNLGLHGILGTSISALNTCKSITL